MQYGRRWAKSNDLRERWERGGASVHSYRSLHKLYRFTNYNRLYSIESSHKCPLDAVSSGGCPVTSWWGVLHLGPGHQRAFPRGKIPAGWRGVPIATSDSWGSYFSDGWQRCPPGLGMASLVRDWHMPCWENMQYVNPRRFGVPCLTGIGDVGWVFLWLSILTLAGPSPFSHADFNVCRGGSNFRDLMFILPYYLLNRMSERQKDMPKDRRTDRQTDRQT